MRLGTLFRKVKKVVFHKRFLLGFAVFLVLYFVLTRGSQDTSKIETVNVVRKDISSEVIGSGQVTTPAEVNLKFGVSGKVSWVGVSEGQEIKEGQAIASIEAEKYQIAVRQAQQDVLAADAELAIVYDDISKASGAESFQNRIKRTNAEAAKNKAVDTLKAAEKSLRDTVLISPIGGTLVDFKLFKGQEVTTLSEIGKIADISNIVFSAEIDESDINKVQLSQSSIIRIDAIEDEEFISSVVSVGDLNITSSTGATVYNVDFEVPPSSGLKLGMNGEASILVDKVEDVVSIPLEAVFDEKYVFIKKDDNYIKKEINLGISSDSDIEIREGLEEGQAIVTNGFEEIEKSSLLQKFLRLF